MVARPAAADEDLFFDELVAGYADSVDHVRRDWLEAAVKDALASPDVRYVLLVGEPGAGKTGVAADLIRREPSALRYFIRRDSVTPLSGGDAASMLLRIGHQLASRRPELFDPDLLEIVVEQRIARTGPGTAVVGVQIADLRVSPFYRTAIRVTQDVGGLAGSLAGIEIAQATVEPRLLELEVLQYLALLDPAAALAQRDPSARIVVVIDALDEVVRRSGVSILDWLERGPELPENVRFVVTSRPNARLELLRQVRAATTTAIELRPDSDEVRSDVRAFARNLFADKAVSAAAGTRAVADVARRLAVASDGNFAYLAAYARALRGAIATGVDDAVADLLEVDALPADLGGLYAFFLRTVRRDVELLGQLEVEDGDERVPAWEGVGQRLLAVLTVARAPVSLEQAIALGSVRVWRSAAASVFERFVPFLDELEPGWRLFHASLAEFLTSDAARAYPDIAVDADEWNRRIVRRYRAAAESWADVEWLEVDDYGLLHLAEHLAETEGGEAHVGELVTPGLRTAMRRRFLTDLPFRRIVETALAEALLIPDFADALSRVVSLDVIRAGLEYSGLSLPPAVLGLMARLGRFEEALARAELQSPGTHQFDSFEAIRACVPDDPRLGTHGGADRLVAAALEIPLTDTPIIGHLGYTHDNCLGKAATALAPYDLPRALDVLRHLARDDGDERDDVLRVGVAAAIAPDQALKLVEQMRRGATAAALDAADRLDDAQLLDVARARLDEVEDEDEQIVLLARLVAAWSEGDDPRAAEATSMLRAAAEARPSDGEEELLRPRAPLVRAAERLETVDPELSTWLLERASEGNDVSSIDDGLVTAAAAWASRGKPDRARELVDRVLEYKRGLGWYGPAPDIARIAVVVDKFDPSWAEKLADEATSLLEEAAVDVDPFEQSRLNLKLGGLVDGFRTWAPERALRAAQKMTGGWIPGAGWDSIDGRLTALALLGLDTADRDPDTARALLEECLHDDQSAIRLGREDARIVRRGFFRPADEIVTAEAAQSRQMNFLTYLQNTINYWLAGRDWRMFDEPADVLRSIEMKPGTAGAVHSWAGALAATVGALVDVDVDTAIDVAGWIIEPCERVIALAALVGALDAAGDGRAEVARVAFERAVADLPTYVPELDLSVVPQGPAVTFLDPSARARFEAALLLPPEPERRIEALIAATGSWYLDLSWRSQNTWDWFYMLALVEPTAEELAGVLSAVASLSEHPEPLQADLLRAVAVWSLTNASPDSVEPLVAEIDDPGTKALATLFAGADSEADERDLVARFRSVLERLPEEVNPLHRAALAATAVKLAGGGTSSGELLAWGLGELESADPLLRALGLRQLAEAAEPARRGHLLRESLDLCGEIRDEYLRNEVLAGLLRPAVGCDARLVLEIVRRSLDADWQVLVAAIGEAAGALIEVAGPGIIHALDASLRRAQLVLAGELYAHLDGVLAVELRTDPLRQEERPETQWLDAAEIFLDPDDLPAHLEHVQDSSSQGADPDDFAFAGNDGLVAGFNVWLGDGSATVWRLVDIRFVFPDAQRAAGYHAQRLHANSEGHPPVDSAPLVGEECHVFGGTGTTPVGVELTAFYYVFRVDRVVVKLFVAQGPDAEQNLTPDDVAPIASRIVDKLSRVYAAQGG
jgi:hypothetical protein